MRMEDLTLTRRQFEILEFVEGYRSRTGYSPTLREMARELGLSSVATVAGHIDSLVRAGLLDRRSYRARSLTLTDRGHAFLASREGSRPAAVIPLLGTIAAGEPIEAVEVPEEIEVPPSLATGRCYALRVRGESMVDQGIMDGDYVVVEEKPRPDNGDTVVALIDGREATLKRFYRERVRGRERIRLQPANPRVKPIILSGGTLAVQGRVRGVIRVL